MRSWRQIGIIGLAVFVVLAGCDKSPSADAPVPVTSADETPSGGYTAKAFVEVRPPSRIAGNASAAAEDVAISQWIDEMVPAMAQHVESEEVLQAALATGPVRALQWFATHEADAMDALAGATRAQPAEAGSRVIQISVTSNDPADAVTLANSVATAFVTQVNTPIIAPYREQMMELEAERDRLTSLHEVLVTEIKQIESTFNPAGQEALGRKVADLTERKADREQAISLATAQLASAPSDQAGAYHEQLALLAQQLESIDAELTEAIAALRALSRQRAELDICRTQRDEALAAIAEIDRATMETRLLIDQAQMATVAREAQAPADPN